MQIVESISRRNFLKSSLAATLVGPVADHGLVKPPLPVPVLRLVRQDGVMTSLASIVSGHATALQLMFTNCATTCPMEGAIFERVQKMLPDMESRGIQLLSLSIDPKNDTPVALAAWLGHFHAGPAWIGAAPAAKDVAEVKAFFGAGRGDLDPHSTQVHILNRSANIVWRTYELPTPEDIVAVLRKV